MAKSRYLEELQLRRDWRSVTSNIHKDQIALAEHPWLERQLVLTEASNKYSDGKRAETTWRQWLLKKFVLHDQTRTKDGDCVVLCELKDYRPGTVLYESTAEDKKPKNVRNCNIARIWAMGADIDGAQSYRDAVKKLVAANIAFVGYSSFNHLAKVSDVGEGIEKFRIIIPFAAPIEVKEDEPRFYPDVVTAVLSYFDIALDPACRNEARVWYYPAHAPTFTAEGRAFIDLNHIDNPPFDVMPFVDQALADKRSTRGESPKGKKQSKQERRSADSPQSRTEREIVTPWLPRFSDLCSEEFDAQGFVMELAKPYAQRTGTNAVDCRCSLRKEYDDHCSEAEADRKTMYVFNGGMADATGTSHERFYIGCNHGRCNHSSLAYLDAIIQEYSTSGPRAEELEILALKFVSDQTKKRYLENRVLPKGYWYKGAYIQTTGGNGDAIDVCSRFSINGMVRDESGQGWGIEITYADPSGNLKTAIVRKADLQGADASWRANLAAKGFWIGTKARQKDALADLFNRLAVDRNIVTFSRPGWHTTISGKVFVSIAGDVIGAEDDAVTFRLKTPESGISTKSGSIVTWTSDVAGKIDRTIPHFGFCTLVGAAGPLIELLGSTPTMFYLLGPSTIGKTAAQICQTSVWGNPKAGESCLVDLHATPNASEAILHSLNGSTVAFDEVGHADPKLLRGLAFGFAAGKGRGRLTKNIELREAYSWHLTGTLSGESSLADTLARHKIVVSEVSGEIVRMPTINHSHVERTSPAKVDQIRRSAFANYGHAGPAFVQALFEQGYASDTGALRKRMEARQAELAGSETGTTRRAAQAFAIVWVAGDIMCEAGILPQTFEVEAYVRWAWNAFTHFEDATKLDPLRPAIERLKTQLQTRSDVIRGPGAPNNEGNDKLTFSPPASTPVRIPFAGAKAYFDGEFFYIPRDFFQDFIGTTAPVAAIVKKLKELGALIPQGRKNNLWPRIPARATEGEAKELPHYKICRKGLFNAYSQASEKPSLEKLLSMCRGTASVVTPSGTVHGGEPYIDSAPTEVD